MSGMSFGELELSGQQFHRLLTQVAAPLAGFLDGLDGAPARGQELTGSTMDALLAPPQEEPVALDELLCVAQQAAADAVETAGPRYFGYIPGGGLVTSAVGELFARTVNRYAGLADLAPGLVTLEESVIQWTASLFGLPSAAGGILTTGGSHAVLSMMLTARHNRLGEDFQDGVVYFSDQAHHCIRKAARIAGLPERALRPVRTSDGLHLDTSATAIAISRDLRAGLKPFLLVGTAGTTNTGAVDPLGQLSALAHEHSMWFHVDGCYGGFFQLTDRGRRRLQGIEHADSISLDPHKSLFMPYGTGALVVRDVQSLLAAHTDGNRSDYLQDLPGSGLPDFAHRGTELTREHRGLRLWLPLHLHGVKAFRAALNEKLDLAEYAYSSLQQMPALEVPHPPDLSTVAFRLRGTDAANQALLEKLNASRRIFLSSTRLDGKLTLRLCIMSHRTHRAHLDTALTTIRNAITAT